MRTCLGWPGTGKHNHLNFVELHAVTEAGIIFLLQQLFARIQLCHGMQCGQRNLMMWPLKLHLRVNAAWGQCARTASHGCHARMNLDHHNTDLFSRHLRVHLTRQSQHTPRTVHLQTHAPGNVPCPVVVSYRWDFIDDVVGRLCTSFLWCELMRKNSSSMLVARAAAAASRCMRPCSFGSTWLTSFSKRVRNRRQGGCVALQETIVIALRYSAQKWVSGV